MKLIQNLRDCADVSLVGGKAANLGALLRAGFIVPDGFVMTTAAGDDDIAAISDAYHGLTAPAVAVRSSAPIEDSSDLSTAGQFKTVLNVRSESELLDAVRLCRASSDTPRARAYLSESHASDQVAMAVLVQRQVSADVAGVLFTQAPQNPDEMLIEAAPGLGDAVVSGRTQPDTFRVNIHTGLIVESRCARENPTLTGGDVAKLWTLGRDVASRFGSPQDIEWAISGGNLFLLQARPITTLDRTALRTTLINATRKALACSGRGPWVVHNLAETLPHPTPLTWDVLRKFMSGSGGFGAMYRRLGFDPTETEFVELILGKVYMDLSRAPGLFGENFPFVYDVETLQRDPGVGQLPPSIPRGSWFARMRAVRRMSKAQRRINIEGVDLDLRLTQRIIPAFVAWCTEEKKRNLSELTTQDWIALWHERERRVFDQFAPEIFFTNFIVAAAMEQLRDYLAEHFWDDSPDALAQLLVSAGAPDRTIIADAELREVAQGRRLLGDWLSDYGHRAIAEFELSAPRWREIPEALSAYTARLKDAPDPLDLHRTRVERAQEQFGRLPTRVARQLRERAERAQRYLIFREDGKHYLMLGYDLLRDMVLDASRRLGADVVWLTFAELTDALGRGCVPRLQSDQRKREYRAEARIALPQFIDSDALVKLDEAPKVDDHDRFSGVAISSGFASGPVWIVESPLEAGDFARGYVLVCPSTDPEWTPLFLNASALVLECGGTLSHGAIVAREMNLPAVVLPDATRLLRDSEHVFVDGSQGVVARTLQATGPDAKDTTIAPEKLPPVSGRRERVGARLRNIGFTLWSVYLFATWVGPGSSLLQSSFAVLDSLFWPIIRAVGRPAAVAIIGAGLALLTALTQSFFTDNARLREARLRARLLRSEAAHFPLDSPRRLALGATGNSVNRRLMGASLVTVGIWLGVYVMTFAWLGERINKANPSPGSTARVIATIDADFREAATLSLSAPLSLDQTSPSTRSLPPIRETLERLQSGQQMSKADLDDLGRYLHRGVPPQTVTWLIRSEVPGLFPLTVMLGRAQSVRTFVGFGDNSPPTSVLDIGDRRLPLRSVTVEAIGPNSHFWNMSTLIPGFDRDINWPWIYLGTYLSMLLLLRRLLQLV